MSTIAAALELMLYGLGGVFIALILLYASVRFVTYIAGNKKDKSSAED